MIIEKLNKSGIEGVDIITATFSNGVKVINVTPHPLTFQDGDEIVEVPKSGLLINAHPIETPLSNGVPKIIKTAFHADKTSGVILADIEKLFPGIIPIGSIIAAQAFPARVFGMTPMPGFERVAPAEKRMNPDKFTSF